MISFRNLTVLKLVKFWLAYATQNDLGGLSTEIDILYDSVRKEHGDMDSPRVTRLLGDTPHIVLNNAEGDIFFRRSSWYGWCCFLPQTRGKHQSSNDSTVNLKHIYLSDKRFSMSSYRQAIFLVKV